MLLDAALVVVRVTCLEISPSRRHSVQQVLLAANAFGVEQVGKVLDPLLFRERKAP